MISESEHYITMDKKTLVCVVAATIITVYKLNMEISDDKAIEYAISGISNAISRAKDRGEYKYDEKEEEKC